MYMPLPHAKHKVKYLNLWFHDDVYVIKSGVEYFSVPQKELYLIK